MARPAPSAPGPRVPDTACPEHFRRRGPQPLGPAGAGKEPRRLHPRWRGGRPMLAFLGLAGWHGHGVLHPVFSLAGE